MEGKKHNAAAKRGPVLARPDSPNLQEAVLQAVREGFQSLDDRLQDIFMHFNRLDVKDEEPENEDVNVPCGAQTGEYEIFSEHARRILDNTSGSFTSDELRHYIGQVDENRPGRPRKDEFDFLDNLHLEDGRKEELKTQLQQVHDRIKEVTKLDESVLHKIKKIQKYLG